MEKASKNKKQTFKLLLALKTKIKTQRLSKNEQINVESESNEINELVHKQLKAPIDHKEKQIQKMKFKLIQKSKNFSILGFQKEVQKN